MTQTAPPARILLVDDDPATLDALRSVLEMRVPYAVLDACESAAAALDRIAAVDYDAIVSDIKMPGMDGLQLMARVLTIRPTTPTLLVTGHGDRDLGVRALNAGAYAFIEKPIDRDYFIAWLKRAVQVRQLSRRVEQQNRELEDTVSRRTAQLQERNAALTRANHQVTAIVESISDGFFALDAEWRFTYVNDPAERLCQMRREEMLGRRWHEVFPDAVGTRIEADYRRAVAQQSSIELERYYAPWQRWFAEKIYPTEDGGFSVFFQDMTERKAAAEALRRSEATLREATEAGQVVVWDMDMATGMLTCKGVAASVWGMTEGTAEAFIARVHPDDQALVREGLAQVARDGTRYSLEYRVLDPADQIQWVHSRGDVVKGPDGRIVRFIGVTTVITERKRAEEALRVANATISTLLECIPERFYGLDQDWRYTYFNEEAKKQLRALGKDPDRLIGRVLWDEFPHPPVETALRRAMRERIRVRDLQYYPPLAEWIENDLCPTADGGLAVFQRTIDKPDPGREKNGG